MNKKLLSTLLACLLGLSAFAYSDFAQTEPVPTPPAAPGGQHQGARAHHPAIARAIRALELAKEEMQAAEHDYGGHRAEALAACDNAIAQLKLALQYANQNPPTGPQTQPNPN